MPHALKGELFSVTARDNKRMVASAFRLEGAPTCGAIHGVADAARAAERRSGVVLPACA